MTLANFEKLKNEIPGYNSQGKRVWPLMEFHQSTLKMRMKFLDVEKADLAAASDYTEQYFGQLVRKVRSNPSKKLLESIGRELRVLWLVLNNDTCIDKVSTPPPGYNREGERIWPVIEFSGETLLMAMQFAKMGRDQTAEAAKLTSEELSELISMGIEDPGQDILKRLSTAVQVLFVVF